MVTFDQATHTYRMGGVVVPSVTQCLEAAYDFRFVDAAVLQKAADFGTKVHKTIELFEQGRLNRATLHPLLNAHLEQWIKFKREMAFVVTSTEQLVYSTKRRYAGTMDCYGVLGGDEMLLDVKTGGVYAPHQLQTAGYKMAAVEMGVMSNSARRSSLYLREDEYEIRFHSGGSDDVVFMSLLNFTHWRRDQK